MVTRLMQTFYWLIKLQDCINSLRLLMTELKLCLFFWLRPLLFWRFCNNRLQDYVRLVLNSFKLSKFEDHLGISPEFVWDALRMPQAGLTQNSERFFWTCWRHSILAWDCSLIFFFYLSSTLYSVLYRFSPLSLLLFHYLVWRAPLHLNVTSEVHFTVTNTLKGRNIDSERRSCMLQLLLLPKRRT